MNLDPRISQALIEAVDTRVDQRERARPYTAYGVVASVDRTTQKASVYVSGDAVPSVGFHFPLYLYPDVGMRVRVVIDPRGDRYIDSIPDPANGTPKTKLGGYLDAYCDAAASRSFFRGFVEGEANPRVELQINSGGGATVRGGDGTTTPTAFLSRDTDGTVLLKGFGRLRFVPITEQTLYNAATQTGSGAEVDKTIEATSVASGLANVYATGRVLAKHSAAPASSGQYAVVRGFGANTIGGVAYALSTTQWASSIYIAKLGGTNGRQIDFSVHAGASGTLTYHLTVTGYFTDDN